MHTTECHAGSQKNQHQERQLRRPTATNVSQALLAINDSHMNVLRNKRCIARPSIAVTLPPATNLVTQPLPLLGT